MGLRCIAEWSIAPGAVREEGSVRPHCSEMQAVGKGEFVACTRSVWAIT